MRLQLFTGCNIQWTSWYFDIHRSLFNTFVSVSYSISKWLCACAVRSAGWCNRCVSFLFFVSPLQSITLWTAWCQRPSSASFWKPLDITPCSSLRASAESVFSRGRLSASQWHLKAFAASWGSSWSRRCLQGSSKIGSWGRRELKVGCCSAAWVFSVDFHLCAVRAQTLQSLQTLC